MAQRPYRLLSSRFYKENENQARNVALWERPWKVKCCVLDLDSLENPCVIVMEALGKCKQQS